MDVIEQELSKLSALELEKLLNLDLFILSICKYRPLMTILGQDICDHKISDHFDFDSEWKGTTGVICP